MEELNSKVYEELKDPSPIVSYYFLFSKQPDSKPNETK